MHRWEVEGLADSYRRHTYTPTCMSIDPDEAEGLRAFTLRVEAYSGASYPERPTAVEIDGVRVPVAEVLVQWREQERLGFRVRLVGGASALLYYVPELDLWSGLIDPQPDLSSILRMRNEGPSSGAPDSRT